MEQIEVGAYNCQIKKQNSKTQSITFIDQPKFNKNEDFYKAKIRLYKSCCPYILYKIFAAFNYYIH